MAVSALLAYAGLTTTPVLAREGVQVGEQSVLSRFVPAEQLEAAAAQQFSQMAAEAQKQNALLPDNHPQVLRLRAIAQRIIPYSLEWNKRASQWQWQVMALNSKELNAFCMPGGKIAFYTGILEQLKLTDDEVAMVMGHEVAHALREHARARIGKQTGLRLGTSLISSMLGLGNVGDAILGYSSQLLTLKFSRGDESDADLVGMELAARAGYDPRAGVSLWNKMSAASKGAPPQWLSTHPSGPSRIKEIQANLPQVMPLYDRAAKPPQRFDAGRKVGQSYLTMEPLVYWGVGEQGVADAQALATHRHDHH